MRQDCRFYENYSGFVICSLGLLMLGSYFLCIVEVFDEVLMAQDASEEVDFYLKCKNCLK